MTESASPVPPIPSSVLSPINPPLTSPSDSPSTPPSKDVPKVNELSKLEAKLETAKKDSLQKKDILDKANEAVAKAHMEYSNSLKEIVVCESAVTIAKQS